MNPAEFKKRFIASILKSDLDMMPDLADFIKYDLSEDDKFHLSAGDLHWLSTVGMPASAAPYLNFSYPAGYPEGVLPKGYLYIGSNNYGDPICIEKSTGKVVYLFHEKDMEPRPMNSSLSHLAECICIFQEHSGIDDKDEFLNCLEKMEKNDPGLGGFWSCEVEGCVDDL